MYNATVFVLGLVSVLLVGPGALAQEFPRPELVPLEVEEAFAPVGFDDNDDSQIVLAGNLPNTCYKVGPVNVKVDRETRKILLGPQAYFYSGCWCAQVQIPFVIPVNLGLLPAGAYEVQFLKADGSLATAGFLPVVVSTNLGPDDYLYAPVNDASVRDDGAGHKTLVLRGTFTNSCMRMQSVRVVRGPSNVLVVQPIAELSGSGCREEKRPFETKVALPRVGKGRVLVHVRSLNGQAINRVVEN